MWKCFRTRVRLSPPSPKNKMSPEKGGIFIFWLHCQEVERASREGIGREHLSRSEYIAVKLCILKTGDVRVAAPGVTGRNSRRYALSMVGLPPRGGRAPYGACANKLDASSTEVDIIIEEADLQNGVMKENLI